MERECLDARHGIRGVSVSRVAEADGRSKHDVRHADLSLDSRQEPAGGRILGHHAEHRGHSRITGSSPAVRSVMNTNQTRSIFAALDTFRIELPSWGFANTGTRFGKFIQAAAATTTDEKFSDAGQVHLLTGVCPTVALHVLWDCPEGVQSTEEIRRFASRYGVAPGSINPNLFQDQEYKYGSFGNPDSSLRRRALQHTKDSIEIAKRLHCRDISLWFADGSNYPGTANIRHRKKWFADALKESHRELSPDQRMLVEYKPFE